MSSISKIVIIGAGNVGFHLGKRFFKKGFEVVQVFSRKEEKAKFLAEQINADFTSKFSKIKSDADIYIIAVSDNAIAEVAQKLKTNGLENQLVVHTSGATPSTVLKPYFDHFGVFYPLQTFRIKSKSDFKKLPLCIDAPDKADLKKLKKLAKRICPNVYQINDRERAILHVAAVFVSNFSNHLYAIGAEILEQENLSLKLLMPLIQETAKKIETNPPKDMQTGPAIRSDENTIKKHLEFLEKNPEYRSFYLAFSKSINPKFGNLE
jgi:predicted short-subunit dehydrogenase-like oxidoreductase (DUF2520 family)